ncbi:tetratricopeptide repeat protein [Carboxylicivirga sediminis]|uniref:Tetratricopeptide repeat protein n=1 Tax=Carboxylicivirga sediminis TaxID=2006564 RepID=A0A941EZV9_9BACT|nr:tetratricopeptide repeat protein [Carboxylicivirga sediminis]MBR8534114.1 tetratricopeptide repeat protein [Carboxylicivirga sediminis]
MIHCHYSFKECILIFILSSVFINTTATSKEDNLVFALSNAKTDKERYELLNKLISHTRQYDYKKSALYATQGELLANNNSNLKWRAKFQFESAITHYYISAYDKALAKYISATNIYQELGDGLNMLKCYNNTGMIYDRIEKYDKAIEYYQHAYNEYQQLDNEIKENYSQFLPQHYNNIASAYNKLNQTERALEYYQLALDKAIEIDFRYILGSIYTNLGIIEMEQGAYNNARSYIDKAITIRKEDDEIIGLANSYYLLSRYYYLNNQLDSAVATTQKTLSIANSRSLLQLQRSSYFLLFEIFQKQELLNKALDAYISYNQINDSIFNHQKMNRLNQLEIAQEVGKIETENTNKIAELKHRHTIFILLLSSLVIIFFLIGRLYQTQKKRLKLEYSKLELDIDTRNRELTTNVMQLIQKNQLINDVVKQLLMLKEEINKQSQKTLHRVILNLQSQTNREIWQEFEMRFNKVHNEFYTRLLKKHPTLTSSEKRLCALLRLNMTSKEIAAITHQTLRGVEVARSRLRKRLGLTGKDIGLNCYLETF